MAELSTDIYQPYITSGLDKAKAINDASSPASYTPYTSSAKNAPVNQQMYDYTANSPLQQIAAPNYKGLMGGDYDKLQAALQQPGQQAATNAYNTGSQGLLNVMGGKGLYGSSIMQQQQTQGLNREYMNALANNASNAVGQRYTMEQAGLKDFNAYNAQEIAGQRGQAMNTAQVGQANADGWNQYNNLKYNADKQYGEQLNNWQNQQNYEQNFLYPQAKTAYDQSQQEMLMNRALALAGQGAPLQQAQQSMLMKQQEIAAMQAAADQQSRNELIGAGVEGTAMVTNGLLSNWDKIFK